MNWTEIRQRASVYPLDLAIGTTQQAQVEISSLEILHKQRAADRARNILGRLGVRKALKAVRDEVWQEGTIKKFQADENRFRPVRSGLVLASSYRTLGPNGSMLHSEDDPVVKLFEEKAALSVSVAIWDIDKPSETSYLRVSGGNFLIPKDIENVPNLERMIKQGQLNRFLLSLHINDYKHIPPYSRTVRTDHPDAQGIFYLMLQESVDLRTGNNALPHQLRNYYESLINQFPSKLRDNRNEGLTSADLDQWVEEVSAVK